jgi:hypothetical protein
MKEAKQKREELKRLILRKSEEWNFPPTEWEATLCRELEAKPVQIVARAPTDQLAWMKMKANECHTNAGWYAEHDPEKKSRHVAGWWVQGPNFASHSLIERDGQLTCITPTYSGETEIPFIPDTEITWQTENGVRCAYRNGQQIGPGVRRFPAFTMALTEIIRRRIRSGGDPVRATNFSDEELEELMREHGVPRDAGIADRR